MPRSGKYTKPLLFFALAATLVVVYALFDPASSGIFPRCPFRALTGLECPGCGSQRAIHALLNFDLRKAASENIMLVLAIPYIIVGFVFSLAIAKNPSRGLLVWRKRLFGPVATIVVLALIVTFWILRNFPCCADYI